VRAIAALVHKQPGIGLPRLRRLIPGLPRNTVAAFLRRLKRLRRRHRRRHWRRLRWLLPGAAWAIDGTWLDVPVAGRGRRALVVVELNSRRVLCLDSVNGERAGAAVACLRRLIRRHGAPLVLKADNGSAFRSKAVAALCRRYGITLLHSPVRRPRFNGTCEVSGRWAKCRAQAAARLRGSPELLTPADLDCAVTFRGHMQVVDDALRARFQDQVAEHLAAVLAEQGLAGETDLLDHVRRSLERVAVQRALLGCHILSIEGRPYRQWLPRASA
jgi:transposase InsO family protein